MLARASSPLVAANMASFGTDHIIDPFERFAEYLALAVAAPERFRLIEILTGLPGSDLAGTAPPAARSLDRLRLWPLRPAVVAHLAPTGIALTVIDPEARRRGNGSVGSWPGHRGGHPDRSGHRWRRRHRRRQRQRLNNLSIAMTAKELNPRLFVVTRQNQAANSVLFEAFHDDFCMVPSRIVARECIAILTTPLLTASWSACASRTRRFAGSWPVISRNSVATACRRYGACA